MTDQLEEIRAGIVSAVQTELDRFSTQVADQLRTLHDQLSAERAARVELEAKLAEVERSDGGAVDVELIEQRVRREIDDVGASVAAIERRQDDVDERIDRVVDEANAGLASSVEAVAQPMVKQIEHRHDELRNEVEGLTTNLRKFDDQAARMVAHVNDVVRATETKLNEVSVAVSADIDTRTSALATRLDEVSAQAARHQSEVSNIVGSRVEAAEDRITDRLVTTETRMKEEVGQRVADIDAYVGRVSAGLDDSVTTLNDRINASEARFDDVDEAIRSVRAAIEQVDAESIDELKDRIASAAGEVELVRIEVDRFKGTVEESIDHTTVRLTELETQVQEHYLDVETAVQLERLEEVERAMIALNPDQFVRKSEINGGVAPANGFASPPPPPPTTATNGSAPTAAPTAS
ncbi:MAG: hypothetical protein AAGA42_08090 [Actinomycetota bacterium]